MSCRSNLSQNFNKFQYTHIMTPRGITQKLRFTFHFLHHKERKFEELRGEIVCLRADLSESTRSRCCNSGSATIRPPRSTKPHERANKYIADDGPPVSESLIMPERVRVGMMQLSSMSQESWSGYYKSPRARISELASFNVKINREFL